MSGRLMCAAAVLGVCLAAWARGEDAVDLSTPKKAALAMIKAVSEADVPGLRATCVGTEEHFKTMEGAMSVLELARKMQQAAIDKFGAQGKQVGAYLVGPGYAVVAARMESFEEVITGDVATVGMNGDPNPARLKKVDGAWKVDLDVMKEDPAQMAREEAVKQALVKILTDVTADIVAGKYQTAREAARAFNAGMAQAGQESSSNAQPAATEPADVHQ
jgi:hypothetical protein